MEPAVSVVVATYERPDSVRRLIADLRALPERNFEVVIVDQSVSRTRQATASALAAEPDDRFSIYTLDKPSLAGARNEGLRRTRAPVVVFLDDDVRLLPGLLAAHRAAYVDPRVGGVVGRMIEDRARVNRRSVGNRVGRGGRVRTNLSGRRPSPVACLEGANMSVRRQAIEQVGGFDHNYGGTALLEEADVSERLRKAGWDLRFEPTASLLHFPEPQGGVRQVDARTSEWWRFHNTGYFVRRHRGVPGFARVIPTFTAIAIKRALSWRDPGALPHLLSGLRVGWVLGAKSPVLDPISGELGHDRAADE